LSLVEVFWLGNNVYMNFRRKPPSTYRIQCHSHLKLFAYEQCHPTKEAVTKLKL